MSEKYDVIIIGAGIGGLTCGCYLAKAGHKVLIQEKNNFPGGYCVTYKNSKFKFDPFAHSMGGFKGNGFLKQITSDLGIKNGLNLRKSNPSDIILTPRGNVAFYSNTKKTIQSFQKLFPREKNNIEMFFKEIINFDKSEFLKLRKENFEVYLKKYFKDPYLKQVILFPMLGNLGTEPKKISSLSAVFFYREFLLDGGYCPKDGMRAFPASLAKVFLGFGGKIQFNTEVKKIITEKKLITGTIDQKQIFSNCRFLVIASDIHNALFKLIGKNKLSPTIRNTVNIMKPSLSLCAAYFGINKNLDMPVKPGINLWYLPSFSLSKLSSNSYSRTSDNISEIMLRLQTDKKGLVVFLNSDFKSKAFWSNNSIRCLNKVITQINKIIPGFSKQIIFKALYTPHMLNKLTLNYKGSAYGWESTTKQTIVNELIGNKIFPNLFIAGHWSSMGTGIRGAAFSGWYVSKTLGDKIKRTKE